MENIKKNFLALMVVTGFVMIFCAGAGSYLLNEAAAGSDTAAVNMAR